MGKSTQNAAEEFPEQLKLANQVCFPLYSASNAVVRAYKPYLDKLDITYLQYIVLMVLWEEGSLNVKEIGNRLFLNSGTLTPLLKRLDAKGLVKRSRSGKDERARIISLTEEGKELRSMAESIPGELVCSLGLEKEKLLHVKALCEGILKALDTDE